MHGLRHNYVVEVGVIAPVLPQRIAVRIIDKLIIFLSENMIVAGIPEYPCKLLSRYFDLHRVFWRIAREREPVSKSNHDEYGHRNSRHHGPYKFEGIVMRIIIRFPFVTFL